MAYLLDLVRRLKLDQVHQRSQTYHIKKEVTHYRGTS